MIIKGISHFNEKGHSFKMPKELTGSEFTTMLNSSVIFNSLGGQTCPGLKLPKNDIAWWRDSKLGMFIHWGLYSILGRGEWAYFREQIPDDEYRELASSFKPELTPEQIAQSWVSAAQDAGMKYMVMVTRHHDGFSLWDSAGSFGQFTSAAMGSHKDYVQAYANACHNAGMKMGFYYSPMDWRFPGYFHPKEQLDNALKMKQQTYDQITELTTRYGQVDIIWYDGGWLAHKGSDCDSAWLYEPVKLNQIVRQNCPKAVINPRSGWEGDFYCDEGSHEIKGKIIPVPWEKSMCMCTGKSWGWMTEQDDPLSSLDFLLTMLVNVICRDGNLILNVGPDRNGRIRPDVRERLTQIGNWMRENGEAVYSTRGGILQPVDDVYGTTFRENRLYLHILDAGRFQKQPLPPISYQVRRAETLDGTLLETAPMGDGWTVKLPDQLIAEKRVDTIIRLTLDRDISENFDEDIRFTGA